MEVLTTPSQLNMPVQMKFTIGTFNGVDMLRGEFITINIPTKLSLITNYPTPLCIETLYSCSFDNSDNVIQVKPSPTYSNSGAIKTFTITLNKIYTSPISFNFTTDYFYVMTKTKTDLYIDITDPTLTPVIFYLSCQSFCK
jgi:hypothetical protein